MKKPESMKFSTILTTFLLILPKTFWACHKMIWIANIDGAMVQVAASSVSVPQQTLQVRPSGVRWGQPNRSGEVNSHTHQPGCPVYINLPRNGYSSVKLMPL